MAYLLERSRSQLAAAILDLTPYDVGIRPDAGDLECNALYVERLCKLVAEHVAEVMADAKDNTGLSRIAKEDAMAIKDIGQDLAAQLNDAAANVEAKDGRQFAQTLRRLAGVA